MTTTDRYADAYERLSFWRKLRIQMGGPRAYAEFMREVETQDKKTRHDT